MNLPSNINIDQSDTIDNSNCATSPSKQTYLSSIPGTIYYNGRDSVTQPHIQNARKVSELDSASQLFVDNPPPQQKIRPTPPQQNSESSSVPRMQWTPPQPLSGNSNSHQVKSSRPQYVAQPYNSSPMDKHAVPAIPVEELSMDGFTDTFVKHGVEKLGCGKCKGYKVLLFLTAVIIVLAISAVVFSVVYVTGSGKEDKNESNTPKRCRYDCYNPLQPGLICRCECYTKANRRVVCLSTRQFTPREAYECHGALNPTTKWTNTNEHLQPMRHFKKRVHYTFDGDEKDDNISVAGNCYRVDNLYHHYNRELGWRAHDRELVWSGYYTPYWTAHFGMHHHYLKRRLPTPGVYEKKNPLANVWNRFIDNRGIDWQWAHGQGHHIVMKWFLYIWFFLKFWEYKGIIQGHFALSKDKIVETAPLPPYNSAFWQYVTAGVDAMPKNY